MQHTCSIYATLTSARILQHHRHHTPGSQDRNVTHPAVLSAWQASHSRRSRAEETASPPICAAASSHPLPGNRGPFPCAAVLIKYSPVHCAHLMLRILCECTSCECSVSKRFLRFHPSLCTNVPLCSGRGVPGCMAAEANRCRHDHAHPTGTSSWPATRATVKAGLLAHAPAL